MVTRDSKIIIQINSNNLEWKNWWRKQVAWGVKIGTYCHSDLPFLSLSPKRQRLQRGVLSPFLHWPVQGLSPVALPSSCEQPSRRWVSSGWCYRRSSVSWLFFSPDIWQDLCCHELELDLRYSPPYLSILGLPWWLSDKESVCQCRSLGFNTWIRKIPGGGSGNPPQYSCLEKSHGQRSLVGYSPWGCKDSDTT